MLRLKLLYMFINVGLLWFMMNNWVKVATIADRFAIPFWIILVIYAIYEINIGNKLSWIPLIIGVGGLIIDTTFVIENRKK